MYLRLFQMLT